jgi:hypothetical protein
VLIIALASVVFTSSNWRGVTTQRALVGCRHATDAYRGRRTRRQRQPARLTTHVCACDACCYQQNHSQGTRRPSLPRLLLHTTAPLPRTQQQASSSRTSAATCQQRWHARQHSCSCCRRCCVCTRTGSCLEAVGASEATALGDDRRHGGLKARCSLKACMRGHSDATAQRDGSQASASAGAGGMLAAATTPRGRNARTVCDATACTRDAPRACAA